MSNQQTKGKRPRTKKIESLNLTLKVFFLRHWRENDYYRGLQMGHFF